MSISHHHLDFISKNRNQIKNKSILFVGDHTPTFSKLSNNYIKEFNIKNSTILNKALQKREFKFFFQELFKELEFNKFKILDFKKTKDIDIEFDLSQKIIPEEKKDKFGFVIDNGSSIYATKIFNSLSNVSFFCEKGGYLLTNIDVNSINRYPILPSPEFMVDFFDTQGFEPIKVEIINGLGKKISDYKMNYYEKGYNLHSSLKFSKFFGYLIWIIIDYLTSPKIQNFIKFSDYKMIKKNEFRELTKKINDKKDKDKNKKKLIKKYFKNANLINRLKNIYFRFLQIRHNLFNKNKIILNFVFKKNEEVSNLDFENKLNSSTIHYISSTS